jgi:putative serine protease PepD
MGSSRVYRRARWACCAMGLACAAALAACSGRASTAQQAAGGAEGQASGGSLQAQYQRVVAAVLPSVVSIYTQNSAGSGVVYDSKGDIVTNAHVVGTAADVRVLPSTGSKELPARVIGTFPPDDLAVVRVESDAGSLRPAKFGDSQDVKIGDIVLAMGNPLGLSNSVTEGIVSATGRTVSESGATGSGTATGPALITAAIQTSAAINPGNSGGALVNLDDQVIGIPTLAAVQPQSGGAAPGIGFAIPSDTVRDIAGQLIADGRVTHSDRATLGITAQTVANADGQPAGVGVVAVKPGGAAERAGIQAGDLILAVAGQATPSLNALEGVLASHKPGDKVRVKVSRSGSESTVEVTLQSLGS